MCGILGTVNRPFSEQSLAVIRHRGPDDSGVSVARVGGHLVTIGHQRLSIVDVSPAGHQPMWTPSKGHVITFNGEVYNHLDLRDQIAGVDYRGHSDTETILHYVAQRGIESSRDFNGIFAFGLLDCEQQKLFLARDPFGVKPLYYWGDETSFVFSSELRGVCKFVDENIDIGNLAQVLRLRYLPAPDTLFRHIHKVRPGHIVEVDLGRVGLPVREYPFARRSSVGISVEKPANVVEQYGHMLEQAVHRQLMADVPIGVLLSGGIDSALIASIAQRHAAYKMTAFTVGFSSPSPADEIADAKEAARVLGLEHQHVRFGFTEFLDLLPRVVEIVEEPLATTSVVPMFHLSHLASKHVKVVMSGQGADEALGGYRRYQTELLRVPLLTGTLPVLKRGVGLLRIRNDAVLRGIASLAQADDVSRFEEIYSVFSAAQIRRLIGENNSRAAERIQYFFDLLDCSSQTHGADRMMSLDLRMNLSDDLLAYTDKITMHHSLECRVPFLDLELVRFIESLPCRYRVSVLRGKRLHRQFAGKTLPVSIRRRKRKGFLSPKAWLRSSGAIRDILLDSTSQFSSYFDLKEVAKVLDEQAQGMNRDRHIFLFLSLYYCLANFGKRTTEAGKALAVPA